MRHTRLGRRLSIALAMLAVLSLTAPPVGAISPGTSALILNSYCSGSYSWRGEVPYDNAYWVGDEQTTGSVKWCFWAYRISDADPNGDYYLVATSADWSVSYNANGRYPPDNYGKIRLSSSLSARDNVRAADPDHSITLNGSCTSTYSFSVSLPPFGVGVSEKFCSGGKLNLESLGNSAAQWGSPDVSDTPHWETAYMLKVGQGAKPLLSATLTIPRYNVYRDSTTLYWKFTRAWTSVSRSWQVK